MLRHNVFEAKLAGMREDGRALALDMLVEPDAVAGLGHTDASVALQTSSGSRRRSSPFNSIKSKARKSLKSFSRPVEVDHEFVLGRHLHRKISGLLALEDAAARRNWSRKSGP